ncbi:MAG: AAA family ATPase, partial [Clostridia bacterium]|nr:AAA family ATPase [Clostridia bacterium]
MNSSLEKDESGFKNENSDNIFIIEGLFNEYNFEINLDKRLNVLIGENGVGKSTILRIIRYLSELDFVGLSRYMFKKIILVRGENRFEINYTDLIPKPMYIISQFSEETMDWIDCLEFDLQVDLKAAYVKNEYFYSVFMSKCYFDEPIGGQILSFIPDNCLVSRRPG